MEVRHYHLKSAQFGTERRIAVVLPDSYRRKRRRYPVLYLHDGSNDWLHRGKLLDLLEEGTDLPEFIAVLPEPADRTREYKLSRRHLAFITEEMVPWADATLRTRPEALYRAVHGVSLGGLVAVALGLRCPHIFSAAGGQGGAYWYWKRCIVREASRTVFCPTRFHISCGRGDGNLYDNRALALALENAGVEHAYEEVPGRHSWACWRRTLPGALRYYFCR